MTDLLPDAHYLVLASRLIPDRDGGFTISVLRRAARHGRGRRDADDSRRSTRARRMRMTHDRAEWVRRGLLADRALLREPLRRRPSRPVVAPCRGPPRAGSRVGVAVPPGRGCGGATVLELPVISGDPAWQLADAPVRIWGEAGPIGWLPGYAGLYRAWINAVAARATAPVVLICEARQIGEALVAPGEPVLDPAVRIVHTTHACHVLAPFRWDSPMDAAWERWFAVGRPLRRGAVAHPEPARDVERRVRRRHPLVRRAASGTGSRRRREPSPVPGRIVMLNSLIPRKRIDHALRALAAVRAQRIPRRTSTSTATGRSSQSSSASPASSASPTPSSSMVTHPTLPRVGARPTSSSSRARTRGRGSSCSRRSAPGCPVVSYDMPYGPRDTLAQGGGLLVADGDVDALADALGRVIGDRGAA